MTELETMQKKTFGRAIAEHSTFRKQLESGKGVRLHIDRKDITGVSQGLPRSLQMAGGSWSPGLAVRGRLVPVGRTTAGAVSFVREKAPYEDPATIGGVVAEGAVKPEGTGGAWEKITEVVKTYAATFKVSRQSLEDAEFLADMVTQRYQGAILRKVDQAIAAALVAASPAGPAGGGATLSAIAAAYAALLGAGYVPDGIIFSATDFGTLAASNGLGLPSEFDPMSDRFWGMQLAVVTGATLTGQFIIGAFAGNSLLAERQEITADIAFENEDDFIHDLATVRVEERSAFADLEVNAFRKGAIGTAPGA